MLELLNESEKEVVLLIIQGHNFNGISQMCAIDYKTYKKLKKSAFAKLHTNTMNKLLGSLFQQGILPEEI